MLEGGGCIIFCFGQFDKVYDISMIDELANILWGIDSSLITNWRISYYKPLSPNSDQQQFSPNDIHTLSIDKFRGTNKMITKEKKCFDLSSNSLNLFLKEMYGDQFGEFAHGYWGIKG